MPIYEYRCSSCGHQQEFLLKVKDAPLTVCTKCGKPTFSKMLSAAGFQLKGSGWYATDFKGSGSRAPQPDKGSGEKSAGEKSAGEKSAGDKGSGEGAKPATKTDAGSSESKGDGGKQASAGSCGGGCSCH